METYTKSMRDLIVQGVKIKRAIKNKIRNLPDNPRIKRLSKRCFVLNSSDLGNNWTAEHHDFKATYRAINRELAKKSVESILAFLVELVEKGKIYLPAQKYTLRPHKDVLEHLQKLLS